MAVQFECTSIPFEGRRVRGTIVSCAYCGRTTVVPVNTFPGRGRDANEFQDAFIRKRLSEMGWRAGNTNKAIRCPGCFAGAIRAAKIKSQTNRDATVVENSNVTQIQPREMGREDKRLIFAKIHEVYGDNSYLEDWTDAKVASDLGVPRAWVKTVREADFGNEGSNEEIKAAMAEATGLLAEVRKIAPKAQQAFEDVKRLLGVAEKVQKTMDEIQRGIR